MDWHQLLADMVMLATIWFNVNVHNIKGLQKTALFAKPHSLKKANLHGTRFWKINWIITSDMLQCIAYI